MTRPTDTQLDELDRIERQVRRYDGTEVANRLTLGGVDQKWLLSQGLTPEEVVSAAAGGVVHV